MQTLEQIAYDAGRTALADQQTLVAAIQQRTGTLLAAHALVASFLGSATLRERGLSVPALLAVISLGIALIIAAVLLGPWRLRFAIDAHDLYEDLRRGITPCVITPGAAAEAPDASAAAGFFYQQLQRDNASRVRRMSGLLGILAALMICQTLAWLTALLIA
jgi:uncharacterized membrane protein